MTKIREYLSIEEVLSSVIKKLDENEIKNIRMGFSDVSTINASASNILICSDGYKFEESHLTVAELTSANTDWI